eukprot:48642_1
MIRKGKSLYQFYFRSSMEEQKSKIHLMRVRCIPWITSYFERYKMRIIAICCLALMILYYIYGGTGPIHLNTPSITESQSSEPLSFLVIGDWGACHQFETFKNQTNVANAMLSIHKKHATQFVISVGDHFYENGLISTQDPRWLSCFENLYDRSLSPWYVAFGNHDMRGSIKAQIDYSKLSPNNRWVAPSSFYAKDFQIPHSKQQFRVIFLDTNNIMCNHKQYGKLGALEAYECDEMYYKRPEMMQEKHGTDKATTKSIQKYNFEQTRVEQLDWFSAQVQSAHHNERIKFVLVVGHHALFSQGPHKIPKVFNEHVQPILRSSNKIIAWFCGHNHALEHYIWHREKHAKNKEMEHDVMHQFLSGSGGYEVHLMKSDAVEDKLDDVQLGFLGKTSGFVSVHLGNENMIVRYWNQYGKMLYFFDVDYPKI